MSLTRGRRDKCPGCGKPISPQIPLKCRYCNMVPIKPAQIVRLRTLLCMTQEEFSRQLGVTRITVWNWENGRRTPWDTNRMQLERLAKGNHVELTESEELQVS